MRRRHLLALAILALVVATVLAMGPVRVWDLMTTRQVEWTRADGLTLRYRVRWWDSGGHRHAVGGISIFDQQGLKTGAIYWAMEDMPPAIRAKMELKVTPGPEAHWIFYAAEMVGCFLVSTKEIESDERLDLIADVLAETANLVEMRRAFVASKLAVGDYVRCPEDRVPAEVAREAFGTGGHLHYSESRGLVVIDVTDLRTDAYSERVQASKDETNKLLRVGDVGSIASFVYEQP